MDQSLHGRLSYVVSFDDGGLLVLIAIDDQTRLPTKVEFLDDDPVYGDVQNELFFDDWRPVGALKFPFKLTYRVNGQVVMVEHIDSIENDIDLRGIDFSVPEDLSQIDTGNDRRGRSSSHWVWRRIAWPVPLMKTKCALSD
jgi:hypothetical protein